MRDARPLRIVHTSDTHLGAYSSRDTDSLQSRGRLMEAAFERVVQLANDLDADALLIAGDFFDNDRVEDEVVEFAGATIRQFRGKTYLLPGNHDAMDPGRLYWRYDLEAMAPNLRIIREHAGQVLHDEDLDLVLWGRAYVDSDWHFRPLEGIPERLDGRWHIAMAHGHFVPEGAPTDRSMLIHEHEVASAAGHWDYLALGHWDPHRDVSSGGMTAIYSGTPLAFSEEDQKAGWASVVDFDHNGARWRIHRTDPREA